MAVPQSEHSGGGGSSSSRAVGVGVVIVVVVVVVVIVVVRWCSTGFGSVQGGFGGSGVVLAARTPRNQTPIHSR